MPPRQRRDAFDPDPLGLLPPLGGQGSQAPSQAFRVQRPLDLLNLQVTAYGLTFQRSNGGPVLAAGGRAGRLEVRFPFQHLGEEAFYEDGDPASPGTELPTPPPVQARAAYGTRLVFSVPAGEQIGYSVEGVLAALRRLPLVVVPLALPRATLKFSRAELLEATALPGGIALAVTADGFAVTKLSSKAGRSRTRQSSVGDLLLAAGQVRTARALLSDRAAVDVVGVTGRHGLEDLVGVVGPAFRAVRQRPRAPRRDETAIEAPYRLLLSPSSAGGFTHATAAVAAPADPRRVELWHTRLGTRHVIDDVVSVTEQPGRQKAVRAVWARDKDGAEPTAPDRVPFRMSLNGLDRVILVRESCDPAVAPPEPIDVDRLYLSSLGAWLDLHGKWETKPYASQGLPVIESWDHRAPMGRDSYVKVEYPGYLFPFGHRCSLVKVTERRIDDDGSGPVAWLFQHKFLVVREPTRTYDDRALPFREVRVRPLVTPWLANPLRPQTPHTVQGDKLFWPVVLGQKFRFTLDCLDHDGRKVRLQAPLLFVAAGLTGPSITTAYLSDAQVGADGQSVAFAKSRTTGDAAMEAVALRFTGTPGPAKSQRSAPRLTGADIVVPAMRHLAPSAPSAAVTYATAYLTSGFGPGNVGEVFLALDTPANVSFSTGTDKAGGFLEPNLPVRGLSRSKGAIGDVAGVAAGTFDPSVFFAGLLPRLFGLFELTDLLAAVGLDQAPAFVSESLDAVAALLSDLAALRAAVDDGVARLGAEAASAGTAPLRDAAEAARAALQAATTTLAAGADELTALVSGLLEGSAPADPAAALAAVLADLTAPIEGVATVVATQPLPAAVKALLERPVQALRTVLAAAETVEAVLRFVRGVDPAGLSVRAAYDWTTSLRNFAFGAENPSDADALFVGNGATLRLAVEARASGSAGAATDVLAEITNFGLNLLPGAPLIKLRFDRLAFRSATGRKADVDVVFGGIEFVGVLAFIETLKDLIPIDGFSDPPFLDVTPAGLTAGFDLALPSVAVGAFSLENISLHADVNVPFLGEAVTVGFSFCTREKPFCLTVMAIGGGGFVGVRLSPKGLVLLEMALEAGARLSLDFGVASGSVSVMVGIYLRLEADKGSLTGYVRIRGEVDVLGLISASITLELSLTYEFDTGKMVGRASIEVEVEVFLLSFSVSVSCERRLAGSNGDPTLAELLMVDADGDSPAWDDYCTAFAVESGA